MTVRPPPRQQTVATTLSLPRLGRIALAALAGVLALASVAGCGVGGTGTAARSPAGGGLGAGCSATAPLPVGSTRQSIESGGVRRYYLLHLSDAYRPGRPTPVVLVFHGRKGTGSDIEDYSGIDRLPAVAVYPIGLAGPDGETSWQGSPENAGADDVGFVDDLLAQLRDTVCVDPARTYATGKSEGAGFASLLACRMPDRIAALATVSGAFYPGTGVGCHGAPPVPVVDFHGTGDSVIEYDGGVSHGTRYASVPDWLRGWASRDGCTDTTTSRVGPDVTVVAWNGCASGAALVHYRVADGGHTWPGATDPSGPGETTPTISATSILWGFFVAHPLAQHSG